MGNAITSDQLNVCGPEGERLEICMNNLAKTTRDWLSIKALVPSLHLLHMARPSISPGRSVFFEGLRFRRDAAAWSLDRKKEWVLQRLRFSLRRSRKLFGRHFPASIREDSCSFVAIILFPESV